MQTIGIIGCGGMGKTHARQYRKMSDIELLAYDVVPQRLEEFQTETDAKTAHSVQELIAKADVVDICVPTDLHYTLILEALSCGKPTICEKPLCRTVQQCEEIVHYTKKANIPLMPAQVVRFFPEFRRARELVQSDAIGTPAVIRTRRGGSYPLGAGEWFGDFNRSGGVILDLMIHDLDWIRWTFGKVKTIFADALTFSGIEKKDYALATLALESGAIAHVEATWADPAGFRVTFEVVGSKGLIEHDSRKTPTLRISTFEKLSTESPLASEDDPYYLELRAFLDAVKTGVAPPVSPEDGLIAVGLCEAAIQSARTRKPVRVDF